jgi:PAS domain S-box-containing protein
MKSQPKADRISGPVPRHGPGTLERARERMEHLHEISSLFVAFDDLDKTFDAALAIAARTLPIRSAIVIEETHAGSRIILWPEEARSEAEMQAAKANAERVYAYLRGTTLEALDASLVEGLGATLLPKIQTGAADDVPRFIAIPLVVGRAPVFGTAQIEAMSPLDEADVMFVNAIANQLALALERRRAWDEDILRRDRAEEGRLWAEQRETRAKHERQSAIALLERFEELIDSLHDIFVWEADVISRRTLYVSARAQTLLGFPRRHWLESGEPLQARVHPDDRAAFEATLRGVLATRRDARCEHRYVALDGRVVWLRTGVHLAGADTASARFQGVSVDVTAEKRAEERQRDQLDFTRAIALSLGEGVVAADLMERITFLNEAAAQMLGRTQEIARSMTVAELFHMRDADGAAVESGLAEVLRTGQPTKGDQHVLVRSDGTQLPVSYTATPILKSGALSGAVVALDDIAERRATEEVQRCLLAASTVLAADLDFTARAQNLARMLVPRLGDFCGVHVLKEGERLERVAWAHGDPARARTLDGSLEAARSSPLAGHALERAVRGGETIVVHDRVGEWTAALPDPAQRELLASFGLRSLLVVPMAIGERKIGALSFATADPTFHYDRAAVALAEELGRRAAYAVENGRLYEEAKRQTLVREQILAVVSHDLRSPLNNIMMATTILAESGVTPEAAATHAIGVLERSTQRAARMIDDLLDFGSLEAGRLSIELQRLAAQELLQEAFESAEAAGKDRGVRVEIAGEDSGAFVCGDRDRILQVISNLAGNAIKVSAKGSCVTLRAEARGPDVLFAVADRGPGIKASDLAHVFERYWRSPDASYKGTGLGLAIAAGIVAAHGGRIWVESEVGVGTTFFFTLPAWADRSS